MILTEKNARAKWCPFASRTDDVNENAGVNRLRGLEDKHFPDPRCIASACMAWRWKGWGQKEWVDRDGRRWVFQEPKDPENWIREGYCGLAGMTNG